MARVGIEVRWADTEVDVVEGSSLDRWDEAAPAGLLAIAVVRACDAANMSIEDLGKQLIEESMRRREAGA